MEKLRHIKFLERIFPTLESTSTEIINLHAILKLPKGTEHFLSDLHGEYEAFDHVLRNCSGVIREKIEHEFSETLRECEREELATVIYYPNEKIDELESRGEISREWFSITLKRMVRILKISASKYSSSKVRKALPENFQYIIQELIYEKGGEENRKEYIEGIVESIVEIGQERKFLEVLARVIQRLTIDRLHIVGDIYDRGDAPEKIMDRLGEFHNLDIQWGNHDILWMGAAAGQEGCIANAVRNSLRYGNCNILEDGYGINLLPLATFAMDTYKNDPCLEFIPKGISEVSETNLELLAKMHKAITIIQFKIEAEIIGRNSSYKMQSRNLLHKIDFAEKEVVIKGERYPLKDSFFPTVSIENPYSITLEERVVIERLKKSFLGSEKLQKHVELLFAKGSIYKKYNGNLLYHGCIPMERDGTFSTIEIGGRGFKGKELLKEFDRLARIGYYSREKNAHRDIFWYLWCGPSSPLFGKDEMTTFERYLIEDKRVHREEKNPYYSFFTEEATAKSILGEFELNPEKGYIINGHVPVKVKKGESPIKAGGRLIIIDGGFSSAYRKETGIAGYTLIYNSRNLRIVSHEPFEGIRTAIENCQDILSTTEIVDMAKKRLLVKDTDIGLEIQEQIESLKELLEYYKNGSKIDA